MKKNIFTELSFWKKKEVIDDEQYKTMKKHYDKEVEQEKGVTSSRFITIVSIVGALFVGAGILLFFSSNWDYLSDIFKTALLIGTMLATYGIGFWLYYHKGYQKTGYSVILLAAIMYGANIFLLGQIYNLGGSWIDAMGIRAVGILPLAYITKFTGLSVMFFLLFNIFLISFIGENHLINEDIALFFIHIMGLFYLSVGRLHQFSKHEEYKRFGLVYQVVGVFGILITGLLTTVFDFGGEVFFDMTISKLGMLSLSVFGLIIILQSIILFIQKRATEKDLYKLGLLLHTIFFIGLSFLSSEIGILVINFYFVIALFYLLYAGVKYNNKRFVNISFLFFIIFLIVKYVDIFSSMLSQSLFLIAGGLFFIVGGYFLEKFRRKFIEKNKIK